MYPFWKSCEQLSGHLFNIILYCLLLLIFSKILTDHSIIFLHYHVNLINAETAVSLYAVYAQADTGSSGFEAVTSASDWYQCDHDYFFLGSRITCRLHVVRACSAVHADVGRFRSRSWRFHAAFHSVLSVIPLFPPFLLFARLFILGWV